MTIADLNDVYSTDFLCFIAQFVKEWNDFGLVGQCYIQAPQFRILFQDFRKFVYVGNLKVKILGIDAFLGKFFGKKTFTKTMSQRVAYNSVFIHCSFRFFWPGTWCRGQK